MAPRGNRRLFCLAAALLFAVSSVAHVYAATEASMKMPTDAMETSAPDHGMDCGGDDKASHAACVAMCATAVATLSDAVVLPFNIAMQDFQSDPELPLASRTPSPEPHPPKR